MSEQQLIIGIIIRQVSSPLYVKTCLMTASKGPHRCPEVQLHRRLVKSIAFLIIGEHDASVSGLCAHNCRQAAEGTHGMVHLRTQFEERQQWAMHI